MLNMILTLPPYTLRDLIFHHHQILSRVFSVKLQLSLYLIICVCFVFFFFYNTIKSTTKVWKLTFVKFNNLTTAMAPILNLAISVQTLPMNKKQKQKWIGIQETKQNKQTQNKFQQLIRHMFPCDFIMTCSEYFGLLLYFFPMY